ncbi:MAG: ABC transporter permease [Planctomycetes bacterium]|jgi:lipopolysaccharide transport system permease protein|nr:ABC transporter permease [Planctomycetota bacterium]
MGNETDGSRLAEIWRLRHFWLALAQQDIKDRYRRSVVGIAWSLIKPAVTTLIIAGVFTSVFDVAWDTFAPFLFFGLITWQFLTESILQGCNAFRQANTFIRVRPIPLAIFPLRVVLSAGIHWLIGLSAAIATILAFHGTANPMALFMLFSALILLGITAWSLACICATLCVRYSDTQQVAEISLQVLFYATPVIYLPESLQQAGWLHVVVSCNPFTAFLEMVRRPILQGECPSVSAMTIALAFTAVVASLAWTLLNRVEKRLPLWL